MPPSKKKSRARVSPRSADDLDVEIGRRLRLARLAMNKSQSDIANSLGLTFQQVQKYEKGVNRIAVSRLSEMCKLLKTTPHDLMAWDSSFTVATPINDRTVALVAEFDGLDEFVKTPMRHLIEAIMRNTKKKK